MKGFLSVPAQLQSTAQVLKRSPHFFVGENLKWYISYTTRSSSAKMIPPCWTILHALEAIQDRRPAKLEANPLACVLLL